MNTKRAFSLIELLIAILLIVVVIVVVIGAMLAAINTKNTTNSPEVWRCDGYRIYRVEYEGNVYLLSPNIGIIQHSSHNRTNIEAVIKSEYELGFFHGVKAGAHAVHVAQAQGWDDNNFTIISNDAIRFHNVFKSLYPGWKHINTSDLEKIK